MIYDTDERQDLEAVLSGGSGEGERLDLRIGWVNIRVGSVVAISF
jgi:hypothetical protein